MREVAITISFQVLRIYLSRWNTRKEHLLTGYLSKIVNQVDIVAHLEKINEQVELIEGVMNGHISLNCGQVEYHLENRPLTKTSYFQKFWPIFCH